MKHLILFAIAVFSFGALSDAANITSPVKITAITGVSGYDTSPQMYGFLTGPVSNSTNPNLCTLNGIDLCNNCPQNMTGVSCTTGRVYGSLRLAITFQVTQKLPAGQFYAYLAYHTNGGLDVLFNDSTVGVLVQQGSVVTLTGSWGEICAAAGVTESNGEVCGGMLTDLIDNIRVSIVLANTSTEPIVNSSGAIKYSQDITTTILAPK